MQRIVQRHFVDEVAFPAQFHHARDGLARAFADAFLEFLQVLRHEPALCQGAVFHVIGLVHLDKRVEERPALRGFAAFFDQRLVR